MSKTSLTIASGRLLALAALGLCASPLAARTTSSLPMAQTVASQPLQTLPTDSMSVEMRAIFALLENAQQLNETAMALLREALKAQQTSPVAAPPQIPASAVQPPLPREISEIPLAEVPEVLEAMHAPEPSPTPQEAPVSHDEAPVSHDAVGALAPEGDRTAMPACQHVEEAEAIDPVNLTGDELKALADSDPEILRERNIGRFHRGLFNYRFIPKGQWAFGLTASYGEFNTDDMKMFDLISDVDLSGHTFSIKPQMQYFLRDNISIGLRLNYTQTRGDIDSFKLEIDDDMNFNIHDVGYKGESYAAAITLSQYLGLSRRGRFGVFNEVELAFSSGNSDFRRPFGDDMRNTHTTTTGVSLTYSPGVSVFVMKNASFHVSFGVFGFSLKNEKQWVDGEESGNRLTSGANFRFNIFNINFGIAIHI